MFFWGEIELCWEQLLCKKTVFQRTNAQYSILTRVVMCGRQVVPGSLELTHVYPKELSQP